jgi:hypothetical protein
MMKKLGIGCLGLIGIVIGLAVIGALVGRPPSDAGSPSSPRGAASDPQARSGGAQESGATSRSAARVGTRENPVPFGDSLVITERDRRYEVSVLEAQRLDGAAAKRLNAFSEVPQPGHEYLAIKLRLRYLEGRDAHKTPTSGASVLSAGRMWGEKFFVGLEPRFGGVDLFAGGEVEGWISVLEIPEGASPLTLNWGQAIIGGGGNWFSLPPDF